MNFSQITKALKEISNISSTNEKIQWLKDHNDEDLKYLFKWYFDKSRITGIAEKKFDKFKSATQNLELKSTMQFFKQVIEYLDENHTGRDEDVIKIKNLMMPLICSNDEEKETFKKLVCKNYPMGIQEKLINKVYPNLIPSYEVMLADKYYDLNANQKSKVFNNREFVIQEKLDGFRCTLHKVNGNVKLISRQGKLIEGLIDIERYVRNLKDDNFVIDGELLLADRESIPSKLQYKATSKIVSTKDPIKKGVILNAFDFITIEEWNSQICEYPYKQRYDYLSCLLEPFMNNNSGVQFITLVKNIYEGNDESVIDKLIVDAKSKEWEGLMVRFNDSMYQWKRSKDLLKVKPFQELDAYIVGYEEGTNSNIGRLGALVCEIDHPKFGNLKFKVGGGFSEDERIVFWNKKDELIGRVVSIQYFEITENTTTHQMSVRFPEFLELKEKGQKVNN